MFLINSFRIINIKIIFSLEVINKVILLLIHVRSSVVVRSKELVLCTLITSVFRVLLSNKLVGNWWLKCSKRIILSLLANKF